MSFKIYTKTGDQGQTSIYGGRRLSKDDIRIEAYGTVDELNAYVGMVRDLNQWDDTRDLLKGVQDRLFAIGSNLASDPQKALPVPGIRESDIEVLEKEMDRMETGLPVLKNFILPGGSQEISFCHLARTVCRRAERRVITLSAAEQVDPLIVVYLNRLSDFFFMLARYVAHRKGVEEVLWQPRSAT